MPSDEDEIYNMPEQSNRPYDKDPVGYLNRYIDKFIAVKGSEYTHTIFGNYCRSLNIPDEELPEFYNIYKRASKLVEFNFTEKQKIVGPLIIDIDFNFGHEHGERQYTNESIETLVVNTIKIIKKYLKVNNDDLKVIVSEKESPCYKEKKNEYKDGIHLIIPLPIHVDMRYFIREELIKNAEKEGWFDDIPFTNTLDDVFDKAVVMRNGWMMYKSKKKDGKLYDVTHVYDGHCKKINPSFYEHDERIIACSVRQFEEEDKLMLKSKYDTEEFIEKIEKTISKTKKDKKINKTKSLEDTISNEMPEMDALLRSPLVGKLSEMSDVEAAKKLVKILANHRTQNYLDWSYVGWTMINISPILLDDFIEFSKRSPGNYEEGCCEKLWESARKGTKSLGISTLHWWAKHDNPEEYKKIMGESINKFVMENNFGHHDDIARVVFQIYKHHYKCSSIKKKIWYEFQGNRWVDVEEGYTLSNKLSDEISMEYGKMIIDYTRTMMVENKPEDYEKIQKKISSIVKLLSNLKNEGFKSAVMSACTKRFYDAKFIEKLDDDPNLIGFDNGIFDLTTGCFRNGTPDDYITFSCGYDYKAYSDDSPEILGITKYFEQVHQDESIRTYILSLIASYIDGNITDQKVIIWTGSGCHAYDENIMMHNGTTKKVQDITHNDKLMGPDGRARTVHTLFEGNSDMHTIKMSDGINGGTEFTVNNFHRLALKYMGQPIISIFDDNHIVTWHETLENVPVEFNESFDNHKKCEEFIETLKRKQNVLLHGYVIPITVDDYINLDANIKQHLKCYRKKINKYVEEKESQYNDFIGEHMTTAHDSYDIVCINNDKIDENKLNNFLSNCHWLGYGVLTDVNKDGVYIISKKVKDLRIYNFSVKPAGKQQFYGFGLDGDQKYVMQNMVSTYNSNGKSTTIDLIRYSFGDYFDDMPVTVLTRKRGSSSGATPEIADKVGKRAVFIQEPEHNDVVYVGYMKTLSGGDWVTARPMYGDPFKFKPQFKLVFTCNKLPSIPATDGGTWRRLRVTPWEAEFVDGKPTKPHQYSKDPGLGVKLKEWNAAFMFLLCTKFYPLYKKNGLIEPKKVTMYTNKYKKDSDLYFEFMSENMTTTNNQNDKESLASIFTTFKNWYREAYNINNPSKKELEAYFEKVGLVKNGANIHGLKFIGNDEFARF